ncbi:hypothetical protein BDD43_5679 [Mucilaginibacter gracilis]|uniref:CCDC81-like prokaryotic HU domain-containing protein n=1 Tax=Mucilaginibacter gracilis TaxID=423350 RepID=A0A495JAA2_9SPHI|nr:hypothetical protein [Mucilaginibacter gracilis]RKR85408.1 hypothetical protein BDD43_5679 [Mucilaginibacter gracilis]
MDIAAVISELLEHHDTLVVPGLGTFYRSRLDGYYSKEQQQFYPPSLQLQFNTELQEDDGVLVAALASQKRVNAASAGYFLEKYVADVLQSAATETVMLGDLGTFIMRRNQLLFTPKKLNNNNELFYGLAPVKLRRNKLTPAVGAARAAMQMPATEKPSPFTAALLRGEPMPGKSLSSVNEKAPEPEAEEPEVVEKKPMHVNIWWLVLILFILVSCIGLVVAYKYKPALFDRFRHSGTVSLSEDERRRRTADSIQHAIEEQKSLGLLPNVDTGTQNKIVSVEAPKDTFAIVEAKFTTLDKAKAAFAGWTNDRYPLMIHRDPGNSDFPYQLVLALYTSVDSANVHLDEYKKELSLPKIYIQQFPYKK